MIDNLEGAITLLQLTDFDQVPDQADADGLQYFELAHAQRLGVQIVWVIRMWPEHFGMAIVKQTHHPQQAGFKSTRLWHTLFNRPYQEFVEQYTLYESRYKGAMKVKY